MPNDLPLQVSQENMVHDFIDNLDRILQSLYYPSRRLILISMHVLLDRKFVFMNKLLNREGQNVYSKIRL